MITSSIVQKSQLEGANRLDAEYFCYQNFFQNDYLLGSKIIDYVQYGTSEDLNEENNGFPVLRLNEINNVFIEQPSKYCNKITKQTFEKLKLKKGDVLICRTNGNPKLVGKSGIIMENTDIAFASYLYRIKPKKEHINSASLVTYLNSRIGRSEIEKNMMTSNQTNFSPAKFREIKIPKIPLDTQEIITNLINQSYVQKLESGKLYKQAENLLLEELGLKDYKIEDNLSFIVNLLDIKSANRMDPDYFQPKYDLIISKIEKNKKRLLELVRKEKQILKINPEKEYNYIEISNVNVANGEVGFNKILGKELPANAKILIKGNELIVSKVRPTRGAVAIIPENWKNDYIASGAFSVFNVNSPTRGYLQIVFRSIIGKLQLEKPTTGTSYPTVTDEDIENIWIPDLPETIQQKIADLVRKSHEARRKSKELLEEAKRKVEEMIEN